MQDRLLGDLGRALKEHIERGLVQQRDGRHRLGRKLRHAPRGGERERDVAAAVAVVGAGARQPGRGATRHTRQLPCIERGIGGEQHDDRTALRAIGGHEPGLQLRADAPASDRQRLGATLIRKHERAQPVVPPLPRQAARGAADAALQAMARHAAPCTGTDAALCEARLALLRRMAGRGERLRDV